MSGSKSIGVIVGVIHDGQMRTKRFARVPIVGEFIATANRGSWFRVDCVVWPFEAGEIAAHINCTLVERT